MTREWDHALCAAERGRSASLAALVQAHGVPEFARERVARLLMRPKAGRPEEVRDQDGMTNHQRTLRNARDHCRQLRTCMNEDEAIAAAVRKFPGVTPTRLQHVLRKGLPPNKLSGADKH